MSYKKLYRCEDSSCNNLQAVSGECVRCYTHKVKEFNRRELSQASKTEIVSMVSEQGL